MKRNIMKYLVLLVLAAPSASCGYLDTIPPDKASPETFLEDIEQAKSLLAGIYNCLYDESPIYITPYTYENMCDNSYNPNTWEMSAEFAKGTQNSSSWLASYKWTKDWQGISRANSLIRGLQNVSLAASDKTSLEAEARFLRAYFYYDLLMFYGRVPLLDENSPVENPAREEISLVSGFIHNDLIFAAENLPHEFGGTRANKAAAYMLRMKLAQYEYDHRLVVECCEKIQELGYSLYTDFTTLFLDEGIENPANREVIFKINYTTDIVSSYMTMMWYHWNSFQTTLSMVDSFFTANGLPIREITVSGGGSIPRDPSYDPDRPFDNRDPRLKLSVLCPGDEYRLDAESRYQANWNPANWLNVSGFRPKKGVNETIENTLNDGNDKILMRYGEVLLAWAESENELNGTANVYPLIDQLRERVGMITLSASLPNLSKEAMTELIRNERRVELFHEGQRWFDIRRWQIAQDVMVDATGLDVSKMKTWSGGNITADWLYEEIVIDRRSFNSDRDYLWPIPLTELQANPRMEGDQNPNY